MKTGRSTERRFRHAHLAALCTLAFVSALLLPVSADTRRGPDALRDGDLALRDGRFADAAGSFQRVVDANPLNGAAHAGLTRALLRQELVGRAAAAAERGLRAVPGHGALLAAYGDVCVRQGNFAKAQRAYSEAAAVDARCARAWLGLANLDLLERRNLSAKALLERAHLLDAADPEILLGWASTLSPGPGRIEAVEQYLRIARGESSRKVAAVRALLTSWKTLGNRETTIVVDPARSYRLDLHDVVTPSGPSRAYWLAVVVNGRKLRLQLDTGAPGIVLKPRVARQSRLDSLADRSPIAGIGDEKALNAAIALAHDVRIGDLDIRDAIVHVLADNPEALADCDGLVGTDLFARFFVRLRLAAQTLDLSPLDTGQKSVAEDFWSVERQPRDGFTPVHVLGHLLLADATLNDSPGFLMVIDSGAANHVLSNSAAEKVGGLRRAAVLLGGISGAVRETLSTARAVTLAFAGVSRPGRFLTFDFTEQNARQGTEISGIIGVEALRSLDLTIDYTNGLVRAEYETK